MIGEFGCPCRPAADLRARPALGIVQQFGHVGLDLGGSIPLKQFLKPAFADLSRGVLGREIAPHAVGHANIDLDERSQRLVERATIVQLQRRNAQTFLVYFGGVRSVGAWHPTADISVMTDDNSERSPSALDE